MREEYNFQSRTASVAWPAKPGQRADGQTRLQSVFEAITTNLVGFLSSLGLQIVLLPFYGIYINLGQNVLLTSMAYLTALPRSYILRRVFNRWHREGSQPRWQSMIEAGIDLAIGYSVSVLMFWLVFPLLGHDVSLGSNAQISAIFYAFAYIRKFILRRIFNHVGTKTSLAQQPHQ